MKSFLVITCSTMITVGSLCADDDGWTCTVYHVSRGVRKLNPQQSMHLKSMFEPCLKESEGITTTGKVPEVPIILTFSKEGEEAQRYLISFESRFRIEIETGKKEVRKVAFGDNEMRGKLNEFVKECFPKKKPAN